MSADKTMENIKTAAEQAEEVELQAQTEPDYGTYTHIFRRPFTFEGRTFERMTFDWGRTLTAAPGRGGATYTGPSR